jgi:hypothetical protein
MLALVLSMPGKTLVEGYPLPKFLPEPWRQTPS